MTLRTFTVAALIFMAPAAWAENHVRGVMGNQDQQQQQQMQQQQGQGMTGGGMGGGAGGGGGAQYESKRDELSKSFEQPAQESRKAMTEGAAKFAESTKAMLSETTKAIQAGYAKDEKLDEKTVAQLSAPPPADQSGSKESADQIIESIQALNKVQTDVIAKQAETVMATLASPEAAAPVKQTMGDRIQKAYGGAPLASANTRTPAAITEGPIEEGIANHGLGASPGAVLPPDDGVRAFRRGLIHNPPVSVEVQ